MEATSKHRPSKRSLIPSFTVLMSFFGTSTICTMALRPAASSRLIFPANSIVNVSFSSSNDFGVYCCEIASWNGAKASSLNPRRAASAGSESRNSALCSVTNLAQRAKRARCVESEGRKFAMSERFDTLPSAARPSSTRAACSLPRIASSHDLPSLTTYSGSVVLPPGSEASCS